MSKEIIVAEPTGEGCSSSNGYISSNTTPFTRLITSGHDPVTEPFDSEKLPVSLVSGIRRFLRVANLIKIEEPRVAYLCRLHAFEVAHNLDRNSSGRGVWQFKTSLLQRLEQDEELTIRIRKEKSDVRELKRVYHEYEDYIIKHGADCNPRNREMLIKARTIASVLFEVLNTVYKVAGSKALADGDDINTESEFFVPYNILPLDQGGVHQAIMQLPEIKAAVVAVRNIHRLPFMEDILKNAACTDLFDWLQLCFGFQKGNVVNQREHLILLLANIHIRQSPKKTNMSKSVDEAVNKLMKKFFKNYTNWCKFLGRKSNIRLPYLKEEAQQHKLLYLGLYLLIWGEAANLRFMPECLCYIFHHMAYELHGMLIGAVSMTTGEKVMPAYGGGSESFLSNVVTPIYAVIREEAMKSKNGTADYSAWRNYDDLNEYFWSPGCFEIGWPMHLDHNFFFVPQLNDRKVRKGQGSVKDIQERKSEQNPDEEVVVRCAFSLYVFCCCSYIVYSFKGICR